MKKTAKTQQEQLRAARKRLGANGKPLTNAALALQMGKSEAALLAWLAPQTSGKHRTMPKSAQLLLAALLANAKRTK